MPAVQKSAMRTRRQDTARQRYQDAKARRACRDVVWERAGVDDMGWASCEECGQLVKRAAQFSLAGHVHEKRARSLGGNKFDPAACLLLCAACHFNAPSGAHRRSVRASA